MIYISSSDWQISKNYLIALVMVAVCFSPKLILAQNYPSKPITIIVPFVAGVAAMTRSKFTSFNVVGGLIWVVSLTLAGYFFGNLLYLEQKHVDLNNAS